jgi:hypothetical protein
MTDEKLHLLTAQEIANYVVCPEAWRLKYLAGNQLRPPAPSSEGRRLRLAWIEDQDLSEKLRFYAKVAYALLVILVFGAFLLEQQVERKRNQARKAHSAVSTSVPATEAK